ncbi:hypothetical protein [Novosphingobium mangrovi (ex Huang et al. 2023)]|uniref:Uncharacterized protein n=1 Tax=Novosphingobium mangrovi (ex Huang et al. 2023) TaxID=2976432 RepID=A0ABT2I6S0_9SPHN|nr:hypothetical protein [Novosphingobium mangrovi (ex Huang et al. 2023)]MCT2400507.1 hypothetical protein [Novosphingobium mangrovi (ex Huang et al. 2023)]
MKTIPLIAPAALAPVALALALSACSGGSPAPEATASSEAVAQAGGVSAEQAAADDTIPEALRGRWGLVPADCTSTKGDAKGLLTVSEDALTFYESAATLGFIKARDKDMITAAFEFSGEGQSWVLDVTLSSPDGGKTLVREDTGPEAAPKPLTYTKCP